MKAKSLKSKSVPSTMHSKGPKGDFLFLFQLVLSRSFSLFLCLPYHHLFFFVSYKDIVTGFRAHPGNPGWAHLKILMSAKTLFPYKVTFTGSRGWGMDMSFGDHHSTFHRAQQNEVPEVSTLNSQSSSFLCHYFNRLCTVCIIVFGLGDVLYLQSMHVLKASKDLSLLMMCPPHTPPSIPKVQHSVCTQSTELSCRFSNISTPSTGGQSKEMTHLEIKLINHHK